MKADCGTIWLTAGYLGAVSLFVDRAEISDEMGILCRWGLDTQTDITATIETRECSNCLDEVGASDFPFQPTTDDCVHDLDTCKQCITTWIGTSLDNGNWKNITCLSVDCGAVLQYADVKRNSSDADMERYERFATRDALSTMPGFRWCLNPECSAGQIHDGDEAGTAILTCEVCDFKRCTLCERAWHQDETCDQYTQRLAAQPGEIDASEAWVANNSRKCPGCQSPIQKNDGCDHMTCELWYYAIECDADLSRHTLSSTILLALPSRLCRYPSRRQYCAQGRMQI